MYKTGGVEERKSIILDRDKGGGTRRVPRVVYTWGPIVDDVILGRVTFNTFQRNVCVSTEYTLQANVERDIFYGATFPLRTALAACRCRCLAKLSRARQTTVHHLKHSLSSLAPHLFYFILFLDPPCMYSVYTSFCLPLFSIFPPSNVFPLPFSALLSQLYSLYSRLPSTFARFLSTPVSPMPTFETLISSKNSNRVPAPLVEISCIFFV